MNKYVVKFCKYGTNGKLEIIVVTADSTEQASDKVKTFYELGELDMIFGIEIATGIID